MFKKKESGEFINSVTVSSRGQQTFSGKDLMQILGALPAARVSPQSRRAAPDEMGAGGCGRVPMKFDLWMPGSKFHITFT